MCQFGDSSKIIAELNITKEEALIGWRNNYIINPFNNKEKYLKALNNDYLYPKDKPAVGLPIRDNSEGIYNYNYYNYYNYNNYNYYNYNYYNYNYNNYNYNNYNYNNYNYNYYNYNYYNIQAKTLLYGKTFKYKEGYRSEFCIITDLIILDRNSEWFTDEKTIKFAEHFNSTVEALAVEYKCGVIEFSKKS